MKAASRMIILFIVILSGSWLGSGKASAQVSVNFQVFYDDLSPYGYWVDNPSYGYVWVPNVSPGFSPYSTNGHWVWTDFGWTWVSDYPWGWAPFHYGRWYSDPVYGPMWVPDNEWGPGWVTWRRSEGYYGWAPIEPGISISIAYSNGYNVPTDRWRFVRDRDFGRTDINNYYVNQQTNTTIINNSTVINNVQVDNSRNVKYNAGPDRTDVQKRSGRTITPVALKEASKPGQVLNNGELQLYKPHVEKNNTADHKPAPTKVANLRDVQPATQRDAGMPPQKENQQVKDPVKQQHMDQPVKGQPSRQQHMDQPVKGQPSRQQHMDQPVKEQPSRQQHMDQPVKEQPSRQQHMDQPVKEQPSRQQHMDQPVKEQPSRQQHMDQPVKDQPSRQQHMDQPTKNQPSQQQRNEQPARQQPPQQQHKEQPVNQQPAQQQHNQQPVREQPPHQQRNEPQGKEQQMQQSGHPNKPPLPQEQQPDPKQNKQEEKNPH